MVTGISDYRWEKIIRAIARDSSCSIADAVGLLLERRPDLDADERKIVMDTAATLVPPGPTQRK